MLLKSDRSEIQIKNEWYTETVKRRLIDESISGSSIEEER